MNSEASSSFWKNHDKLSVEIKEQAKVKYRLWKENPFQPGLQFKCVNMRKNIWSVRITDSFRALGIRADDSTIVWFWVGDHREYLRIIK